MNKRRRLEELIDRLLEAKDRLVTAQIDAAATGSPLLKRLAIDQSLEMEAQREAFIGLVFDLFEGKPR